MLSHKAKIQEIQKFDCLILILKVQCIDIIQ